MSGLIEIDLAFESDDADPNRFEEFLDSVMDELGNIGVESDYSASLASLTATWSIDVPDGSETSLIDAISNLRTALHAAGCVTAAWPSTHKVVATRNLSPV